MNADAPVITIDGPSGTGKGTVCGWLAAELGWHLLDSGALYRVVAYDAMQQAVDLSDEGRIVEIAHVLPVEFDYSGEEMRVLLRREDVNKEIRTEQAGVAASRVAAMGAVRDALLQRQREFQVKPGLVADGRDMGTVVFPAAALKIYLTASAEERAQRRYKQLIEKGNSVNLAQLLKDIAERDQRDQARAVSPLKPAADAIILDTTHMSVRAVEDRVKHLVRERGLV